MLRIVATTALLSIVIAAFAVPAAAAEPWSKANWVWDASGDDSNTPRLLRKTFEVTGKPKSARAWVTVDDVHTAHLNGQKLGSRPDWQEPGKYDLMPHLKAGKNVLAVEAINNGGPGAAIAWIEIVGEDGKTTVLGSDASWKLNTVAAPANWTSADFDDAKWPAASVLGPAGMAPYNLLGGGGNSVQPNGGKPLVDQYQSADKQLPQFVVPDGYKVELVAAEPLLINPVSLALDEKGRMYVGESHTYRYGPSGSPVKPFTNPIVMLDPQADGSFKRVVVTEGFDDPCMGILVKNNQMWVTSNQFLYRFDLQADGTATNKTLLLEDKSKAWNPFGFFTIKWGPEGLLYLCVGDHNIKIDGPTDKGFGARKNSGLVCRMKPDGSNLELLTQGFRVPYAFEMDPFGQLWLLSNGEGNPNRYVKAIDGVDYHCYTRTTEQDWLTSKNPLAPPVIERPRGAATSLLHYYGGAFPKEMIGSQFLINWGPHGFGNVNHTLDRYVPDAHGNVEGLPEQWLRCDDPHFRPTTVLVAPDGNLLVADWYGRDDESDVTGRIWKVSYTGNNALATSHKLTPERWTQDAFLVDALGHPDPAFRARAMNELAAKGNGAQSAVSKQVSNADDALAAASALWTLARIGTPESLTALAEGGRHPDFRVRRLALKLAHRLNAPNAAEFAKSVLNDRDPAVRVAAAIALPSPAGTRDALLAALPNGVAADRLLRYEAAWHLARTGTADTFAALQTSPDADVRLTRLIAIDIALYEKFDAAPAAADAVAGGIADPSAGADLPMLLDLATMHRGSMPADASAKVLASLQTLLKRPDTEPATIAKAVLLVRSMSRTADLGDAAATAIKSIAAGSVPVRTAEDQLAVLELLGLEKRPDPFAIQFLGRALRENNDAVREAAASLAVRFGRDAADLSPGLWRRLKEKNVRWEEKVELLGVLAAVEPKPDAEAWSQLFSGTDEQPQFTRELVRSWRRFAGREGFAAALTTAAPDLIQRNPAMKPELAAAFAALRTPGADAAALDLPATPADEAQLRDFVVNQKPSGDAQRLGRLAFNRAGCAACHSAGYDTKLGPPLAGIGATQTRAYLLESILEPSKVIKTGFESEVVDAGKGNVYSGLVREDGDHLRILAATSEDRVPLAKIVRRRVQKLSIMPEELEKAMSPAELSDVVSYMQSLKAAPK